MNIDQFVDLLTIDILHKISIDRISLDKREEFIEKYNKVNYKKIITIKRNIPAKYINKYYKYKSIYATIIIQKYYRRYYVRLKFKNKKYILDGDHNH